MHPSIEKKCQKENDSFFYRFPFDTPFQLFSVFQRILRQDSEVIVFRLPVFLEFTTFYRHENAPQLCIKIGVRIWLKTLILIQCTLCNFGGCIFGWGKSYRFIIDMKPFCKSSQHCLSLCAFLLFHNNKHNTTYKH